MKTRERTLDEFVIEAVANDYEMFECIVEQITKWSLQVGLNTGREELIDTLGRAIRGGYALAYLLSPREPHSQVVEFSRARIDELWFYVTPKGKEFARALQSASSSPS